ncbi:MAG: 4-hydroxyphenylacetate 3-hydroxylase N-terminal domain-containing protein [Candidatus Binataceae bacterium]
MEMAKSAGDGIAPAARAPMTGAEYLESIRDGREVYICGERVKDVTMHPAFRNSSRMIARVFDALHDPEKRDVLTTWTDTGNGGYTHRFYRIDRNAGELLKTRDAIAESARIGFGWLGRSPEYKASFLATLGPNADYYKPFDENARRWYRNAQDQCLFLAMSLINPPVNRTRPPDELTDFFIRAERETDAGIIVSGAKCVATSAAISHYDLIGFYGGTPLGRPDMAIFAFVPLSMPGLKIVSRTSYEMNAAVSGSVFDYPLSSRFDENDAILVFDHALIPWENVLIYRDVEKANGFFANSGWIPRFGLHGCTRLAVKLDFLAGVLTMAAESTGARSSRFAQMQIGEVLAWRHMFWGLTEAMANRAEPWREGAVLPNLHSALAYRVLGPVAYPRVLEIMQQTVSSGLIYQNSHAADFSNPDLKGFLEKYMRGSEGQEAQDRVKLMKLAWDAIGTEFGGRHEIYERSFAGNYENIRIETLLMADADGCTDQLKEFVRKFLGEYDLNGWRAADMIDSSDVNRVVNGRKREPMTEEQRKQIAEVMAAEHVAFISTLGEQSPTATVEAFAETPEFDIVMIMAADSDRFQNVSKRSNVSLLVMNRYGDVSEFRIKRLSVRAAAREVRKDSDEWNQLKAIFLKKNPFEEPFFGNPALRMLRIKPKSLKYADALNPPFTVEL